jgi:hypothetical protein
VIGGARLSGICRGCRSSAEIDDGLAAWHFQRGGHAKSFAAAVKMVDGFITAVCRSFVKVEDCGSGDGGWKNLRAAVRVDGEAFAALKLERDLKKGKRTK